MVTCDERTRQKLLASNLVIYLIKDKNSYLIIDIDIKIKINYIIKKYTNENYHLRSSRYNFV
jgi:hypothetical protein